MNVRVVSSLILVSLAAFAASLSAEGRSLRTCDVAQRHQFDFWIGSWRVVDRGGKFQGTNTVTSEYAGCALQEHWAGADGSKGSSFNTYLPGRNEWHQTWVDNNGLTLILYGGIKGNAMVLSGVRVDPQTHRQVLDRISWTPLSDGRVRQHWQESDASGNHWTEIFDGYYSKAKS